MKNNQFTKDVLKINAGKRGRQRFATRIRELLAKVLRRRGLVVALSGGIDSSVTTALAAKAIGPERTVALLMPERHSADETLSLSSAVADHFGVVKIHENISGDLSGTRILQTL